MQVKPIEEQVIVLVGATSGIGRAAAYRFAERGARLVLAGRSLPALLLLVDEVRERGGQALAVQADVTDVAQVQAVAERAEAEYGRIDTWINCAAVAIYAPFEKISSDEFKRVIDVNLTGQVHGAMAVMPVFRRQRSGTFVQVSSVEARRSFPYHTPYTASKFALRGFLDALRMEVEYEGLPVAIVNVMPSSINTPFFDKALTRMGAKPRPVPPVYTPELAAETLLYVAEHPVREIYVGGVGKLAGLLQRLSPALADRLLLPMSRRGQVSDQPKSADAPNNLYQHVSGQDRVSGSYSDEAKPVSLYSLWSTRPALRWGTVALLMAAGAVMSARAFNLPEKVNAAAQRNRLPEKARGAARQAQRTVRAAARQAAGSTRKTSWLARRLPWLPRRKSRREKLLEAGRDLLYLGTGAGMAAWAGGKRVLGRGLQAARRG